MPTPTLADFGLDENELLVELARETMDKLIAAEKRLNGIKNVCRAWDKDEIEDYGALAMIEEILDCPASHLKSGDMAND